MNNERRVCGQYGFAGSFFFSLQRLFYIRTSNDVMAVLSDIPCHKQSICQLAQILLYDKYIPFYMPLRFLHHCKRHVTLLLKSPFRHLEILICLCLYSVLFRCKTCFSTMTAVVHSILAISAIPWFDTSLYEQFLYELPVCIIVPMPRLFSRSSCCLYFLVSFFTAYIRDCASALRTDSLLAYDLCSIVLCPIFLN